MILRRSKLSQSGQPSSIPAAEHSVLDETAFRGMIALERKRSERSRKPVLLVLVNLGECPPSDQNGQALKKILAGLSLSTRDTDVTGWYKQGSIVGVMFTEIGIDDHGSILGTMMSRVSEALKDHLNLENSSQISVSFHVFPGDWNQETGQTNPALYPDLEHRDSQQRVVRAVKRLIDIAGSVTALVLLSPFFALAAALVRLSSQGPILFRQERVGQLGKPFTFLKFRSMYVGNDGNIHQDFMKGVIRGSHNGKVEGESKAVYKMTDDPRITPIGRFLRKSSLDELPQFINVLKGEMSLVGPRPPLAYEVQEYDIWHRRRVLEVKPGITGLWQVNGRSRVSFDDMVRLDLQYVRTWSLWLDIKILLKTPLAVFKTDDAF